MAFAITMRYIIIQVSSNYSKNIVYNSNKGILYFTGSSEFKIKCFVSVYKHLSLWLISHSKNLLCKANNSILHFTDSFEFKIKRLGHPVRNIIQRMICELINLKATALEQIKLSIYRYLNFYYINKTCRNITETV